MSILVLITQLRNHILYMYNLGVDRHRLIDALPTIEELIFASSSQDKQVTKQNINTK